MALNHFMFILIILIMLGYFGSFFFYGKENMSVRYSALTGEVILLEEGGVKLKIYTPDSLSKNFT